MSADRIPNLVLRGEWYQANFYDHSGRRIRVSLKTRYKDLAEQRLRIMMKEDYENGFFEMKRPVRKTFSELAEEVLVYAKGYTKRYEKVYLPAINGLKEFFGKRKLQEITRDPIMQYHMQRRDTVSVGSANTGLKVLRKALSIAMEQGYIKDNPARRVKCFTVPERPRNTLKREQLLKLLDCCNQQLKEIVLLALLTGMRKGEIRNLKWENVDLEKKHITLYETKSNTPRTIEIEDGLMKMLLNRFEKKVSKYVFPNEDGTPYYDFRSFQKALKLAGIENFRFHDLRHTFATWMMEQDVGPLTLQKLMGHKKFETTLIYINQDEKAKREAVKKLEKFLFGDKDPEGGAPVTI